MWLSFFKKIHERHISTSMAKLLRMRVEIHVSPELFISLIFRFLSHFFETTGRQTS